MDITKTPHFQAQRHYEKYDENNQSKFLKWQRATNLAWSKTKRNWVPAAVIAALSGIAAIVIVHLLGLENLKSYQLLQISVAFSAILIASLVVFLGNLVFAFAELEHKRALAAEAILKQQFRDTRPGSEIDIGEKKNSAREALSIWARDEFIPLSQQIVKVYAAARDAVQNSITQPRVRGALGFGTDRFPRRPENQEFPFIYDLANLDRARTMSLHDSQGNYYRNYIELVEKFLLTNELIELAISNSPRWRQKLEPLYCEFVTKFDKLRAGHEDLSNKFPDLTQIGRLRKDVDHSLVFLNWETVTIDAS